MIEPVYVRHAVTGQRKQRTELVVAERRGMGGVSQVGGRIVNVRRGQCDLASRPGVFEALAHQIKRRGQFQMFDQLEGTDHVERPLDLVDIDEIVMVIRVRIAGSIADVSPRRSQPPFEGTVSGADFQDRDTVAAHSRQYRVVTSGNRQTPDIAKSSLDLLAFAKQFTPGDRGTHGSRSSAKSRSGGRDQKRSLNASMENFSLRRS